MMDTRQPACRDWNWLQDTYWYVPMSDLPAMQYDAARNTLSWVTDQTVWHIVGYRDGYFWGTCSVLLLDAGQEVPLRGRGSRPVGLSLLGTITPEGRVHLTFVPGVALTSDHATTGIGCAIEREGQIALEMQMSTGSLKRTAHWARMVQTRDGDPSWDSLPGIGLSVPAMLNGIDSPGIVSDRSPQ